MEGKADSEGRFEITDDDKVVATPLSAAEKFWKEAKGVALGFTVLATFVVCFVLAFERGMWEASIPPLVLAVWAFAKLTDGEF